MIITLGKTSRKRLDTCCPPLQEIVKAAAADPECPCDFGVVCGARGRVDQMAAYDAGLSNAEWGESDHNVMKGDDPFSMGVDLAPYDPSIRNYVWDNGDQRYEALAGHILTHAAKLGYSIEWGGTYDVNGAAPGGSDKPHYSLKFTRESFNRVSF